MKAIIIHYLQKKSAILLLVSALFFSTTILGQCTNGTEIGSNFTPNYSGNLQTIQSAPAGNYVTVNILPNKYYTFVSTLENQPFNGYTGFITITNENGTLVLANGYGSSPLYWQSTSSDTITIRYYIHGSSNCTTSVSQYNYSIVSYNSLCEVPTNLTTTNITNSSATLNWTPPVSTPGNGYQYYINQDGSPPFNNDLTPPTGYSLTNSKVITNLNQNTTYYWWVRSSCGTQNSIWIRYGAFTTSATICNQPSNLSISALTGNSALLSWTAPSPTPSDGYQYYYNTTGTTPNNHFDTNNTSVTLNNLQPSTTYYYWVKSVCGFNIFSPWLFGGSFTTLNGQFCNVAEYGLFPAATYTPTCTGSVENIVIDAYSGEYSNVAITANTSYTFSSSVATDYITLTSQDGNTLLIKGTTPLLWNSGTNSGVIRYYFHKSAACDSENIERIRSITCNSSASCLPPSNLSSFNVGSSTASISWTAAASNPSLYDVYFSTSNTAPNAATTPNGSIATTAASLSSLSVSTTYYFWVRSNCNPLVSSWVSGGSFTTTAATCNVPSNITKTNITSTSAQIDWTAASPIPSNGYQFYYSTVNSAPINTTTPLGSSATTTTTISSLTSSTTYYIWVRSNCGGSQSVWVSGGSFTTTIATCNPPSNLNSTAIISDSAQIFWTAASPAPTQYDIYFSISSTVPTAATTPIGSITGTSAELINLTPSTTYYFWVRSNCGSSNSAWISGGSFTTTQSNCTQADFGLYPGNAYTPTCSGTAETIVNDAYAGEYSLVNILTNKTYTFSSSVATDFITITNETGTVVYTSGATPLVWQSGTNSGVIRYFLHSNSACGNQNTNRTRYITCATICTPPTSITVSGITNSQVTLEWSAVVPAPQTYQYYISTSNTPPTGTTASSGSSLTTTRIVTGLSGSTTYYLWGRCFCGPGASGWISGGSFTMLPDGNCTQAVNGLLPSATFVPTCSGINEQIAAIAWASEYSNVSVISNREYTFTSSVATDYVTITNANASTIFASGTTPLVWQSGSNSGVIRYYLHTNIACGSQNTNRIKSVKCSAPLAIDENELQHLVMFPNPATHMLTISNDTIIDRVELYTILGQLVKEQNLQAKTGTVDISTFSSGTYFVKIMANDQMQTMKLIKE